VVLSPAGILLTHTVEGSKFFYGNPGPLEADWYAANPLTVFACQSNKLLVPAVS
jgi:hypothetical protein